MGNQKEEVVPAAFFSGEKGPSGQEHLAEISMNFGGEEERGTDRILEDSEN